MRKVVQRLALHMLDETRLDALNQHKGGPGSWAHDEEDRIADLVAPDQTDHTTVLSDAQRAILKAMLRCLDRRAARMVYDRYLSDRDLTLEEIGETWGLSREWARHIINESLEALREHAPELKDHLHALKSR